MASTTQIYLREQGLSLGGYELILWGACPPIMSSSWLDKKLFLVINLSHNAVEPIDEDL